MIFHRFFHSTPLAVRPRGGCAGPLGGKSGSIKYVPFIYRTQVTTIMAWSTFRLPWWLRVNPHGPWTNPALPWAQRFLQKEPISPFRAARGAIRPATGSSGARLEYDLAVG